MDLEGKTWLILLAIKLISSGKFDIKKHPEISVKNGIKFSFKIHFLHTQVFNTQ
jgi:alpha-galactosidase